MRHGAAIGLPAVRAEKEPRRALVLAVLCVSLLIVTLDNTVLNVALPTLVDKLQASSSELQWIVDAYVLVFAGLLLVSGSLADRIGRKRTFLAGLVAFAACSTWAAYSGSVDSLIAARASMGIGGALIMPSTLAIISNTFTETHERRQAIGLWAATSGAGIALGPIVGGLLLEHFWWGSIFLVNVPIAAVGFLLALVLVPDSRDVAAKRPDLVGSLLSICGLGLLLYAIIEAPTHGWTSPEVAGTGTGGIVALAVFAGWERRTTHPMLKLDFFRDRAFSAPIASVSLIMFGLFGGLFVLTQYLQFALGYAPLDAGVRMLPAAGAIVVVAPLSAVLQRTLSVKLTVAAGMAFAAGGLWYLSDTSTATRYRGIVLGMTLVGVGAGLVIPAATASVIGSVPPENTGVGSATNGTFLQTGGAFGVAVVGSLLSRRYDDRISGALAGRQLPPAVTHAVHESLGSALIAAEQVGGAGGAAIADAARAAFVSGMDLGVLAAAIVGVAGAVVALLVIPSRSG